MEFPKIKEIKDRLAKATFEGGSKIEVSNEDLSYLLFYNVYQEISVKDKLVEQLKRFEFECDPSRSSGAQEEEFIRSVMLRKELNLDGES